MSDRDGDIERHVIRFAELESRRSTYEPADMKLDRFRRERYSVVGRPAEGSTDGKGMGGTGFSVVYLRCEPGRGVACMRMPRLKSSFPCLAGGRSCSKAAARWNSAPGT